MGSFMNLIRCLCVYAIFCVSHWSLLMTVFFWRKIQILVNKHDDCPKNLGNNIFIIKKTDIVKHSLLFDGSIFS